MNSLRSSITKSIEQVSSIHLSRMLLVGWMGVILALGIYSLAHIIPQVLKGTEQGDYSTFYVAGRMALVDPGQVYNMSAMIDFVAGMSQDPSQAPYQIVTWAPGYSYPPFFTALMRGLSSLPFKTASFVWVGMNLICLILSIPLLIILAGLHDRKSGSWYVAALGIGAVILFSPVQEVFMLGQATLLLLALSAGALVLLRQDNPSRDFVAGVLLGLATAIKIFPVLIIVYLLFRKKWHAVIGSAIAFFSSLVIGIIGFGNWQTGWSLTWNYFTRFIFGIFTTRLNYQQYGNQALSAFFIHLLGKTTLAEILGLGSSLVFLLVTIWLLFGNKRSTTNPDFLKIDFVLVFLLPLIATSWVPSNYCTLALLALAFLLGYYSNQGIPFSIKRLHLIAFIYMLLAFSSYEDWLAFPVFKYVPTGLVGILIIWGWLIKIRSFNYLPVKLAKPNP